MMISLKLINIDISILFNNNNRELQKNQLKSDL